MEAYTFTAANEDYKYFFNTSFHTFLLINFIYEFSCYSYDTRTLKQPINVHKDHVSAVTSIDYAPTGLEFVTGSYDKTVRIFECDKVFFLLHYIYNKR